jgi:hypothetical protein
LRKEAGVSVAKIMEEFGIEKQTMSEITSK